MRFSLYSNEEMAYICMKCGFSTSNLESFKCKILHKCTWAACEFFNDSQHTVASHVRDVHLSESHINETANVSIEEVDQVKVGVKCSNAKKRQKISGTPLNQIELRRFVICPVELCDKTFICISDLIKHTSLEHRGVQFWSCFLCLTRFGTMKLFEMHFVSAHPESSYMCNKFSDKEVKDIHTSGNHLCVPTEEWTKKKESIFGSKYYYVKLHLFI